MTATPVAPMLARAVSSMPGPDALPGGLVFEPKYDGFRVCITAEPGKGRMTGRGGGDLARGFPEIERAAAELAAGEEREVVLDGELVVHRGGRLDFSALQERARRTGRRAVELVREAPAFVIVFDFLQLGDQVLLQRPYRQRRAALEELFSRGGLGAPWALSPSTTDAEQAQEWLGSAWAQVGVEGCVAKGAGQRYLPGVRGWLKVRSRQTAEAVIGGVTGPLERPATVLLGRYDGAGDLRLVARSTPLSTPLQAQLGELLAPAVPGHPWEGVRFSAGWGTREPLEFACVRPELVGEFDGDTAVDRGRWRHPVRLTRLRLDRRVHTVPRVGAEG